MSEVARSPYIAGAMGMVPVIASAAADASLEPRINGADDLICAVGGIREEFLR